MAAKHSIAYLVITDEDRYTGSKKSKSTKPRFYDGELQTLMTFHEEKIDIVYGDKLDFACFSTSVKVNKFFRILNTVFLALTIDICGLLTSIFRDASAFIICN